MHQGRLAAAMSRAWPVLIVGAILGVVAGWVSTFVVPATASSSSEVFFSVTGNQQTVAGHEAVGPFVHMATSLDVMKEVASDLSLADAPDDLAAQTKVSLPAGSGLLRITVEDTDPQRAADIANAVAEVIVDRTRKLFPAGEHEQNISATVLFRAERGTPAGRMASVLRILIGALAGTMIAACVAALLSALRPRLRSLDDLGQMTPDAIICKIRGGQVRASDGEDELHRVARRMRALTGAQGAVGPRTAVVLDLAGGPNRPMAERFLPLLSDPAHPARLLDHGSVASPVPAEDTTGIETPGPHETDAAGGIDVRLGQWQESHGDGEWIVVAPPPLRNRSLGYDYIASADVCVAVVPYGSRRTPLRECVQAASEARTTLVLVASRRSVR